MSQDILDVHVIGVGKDQYNEYLDQMVEGRILPWTEDSQSDFYPVWTEWEASQRDVYFINRNGIVDTTFNITPYDPNNPEDYVYIINLIHDLRNDTWGQGSIIVDYKSGWNIVGLPLEVEDANYQSLFPNVQSGTLYSFDGTYQLEQYLELGIGYLLKLTSDDPVTFTGTPINELTISLSEGWNLFSGLTTSFSPGELYSEDIIQNGTIYGLDIVYYSPESIDPGMGYWVRATQDGEITLSSTSLAIKTVKPINPLSNANTLVLSSGTHSTTLFFGKDISQGEKLNYSLPPTFPKMAFDARFTDDMKVVAESGEIVILNQFKTLTVAYDIKIDAGEHMNWVLTSDSGGQFILEDTGEITISSVDSFTLDRVSQLPKTFTLNQNFPNPFNNKTSIHYYLPVNAHVNIQIITLTGTLINTLINNSQINGFHHVEWNGMDLNNNPVSSGVYIYKLSTNDHSLSGKCVFLK